MSPEIPPLLPQPPRSPISRRSKLLIGLSLLPACFVAALILLRLCGLVRPFSVYTGAMTPAVCSGDHFMVEDMTFLFRQPRRGDIVAFKTDGTASLPLSTLHIKRVAGEPGDHVRISGGKLFVNEKQVTLSNAAGEITYDLPPQAATFSFKAEMTIPSDCYFVLGDNSTNSLDSRYWGGVPRGNIIGRASFCYWPPKRIGGIK